MPSAESSSVWTGPIISGLTPPKLREAEDWLGSINITGLAPLLPVAPLPLMEAAGILAKAVFGPLIRMPPGSDEPTTSAEPLSGLAALASGSVVPATAMVPPILSAPVLPVAQERPTAFMAAASQAAKLPTAARPTAPRPTLVRAEPAAMEKLPFKLPPR